MEFSNKKLFVIALILSLITTFVIYYYIKSSTGGTEKIEYINVPVAVKNIPPGVKINLIDIKDISVPKEAVHPKAYLNKADIVGQKARERVLEGEPFFKDRLAVGNDLSLSFNIPEGKRAISINVNEAVEVANFIRPGDFVDILITADKEETDVNGSKTVRPRITKTILQNIQILGVGQEQFLNEEKFKEIPKTVTLAVDIKEAEKLAYATEYGIIKLALRGAGDKDIIETPGVIRSDIIPDRGVVLNAR